MELRNLWSAWYEDGVLQGPERMLQKCRFARAGNLKEQYNGVCMKIACCANNITYWSGSGGEDNYRRSTKHNHELCGHPADMRMQWAKSVNATKTSQVIHSAAIIICKQKPLC